MVPEALVDFRIRPGKARGLPGARSDALLNLLKDLARILLQVVVRLIHLLLLGGQGVAAIMGSILGGIKLKVKSKWALTLFSYPRNVQVGG